MRIDFDGQRLASIDDAHWKLTLPAGSDVATMAARFRVVMATTCFEEALPVESVGANGDLHPKWPAPAMVYVDREGVGSAVSVSVGSFVVDQSKAQVLVGACPTARDIRVDDAVVGSIGASTIVDAKGGHCYELVTSGFPSARLEGKRTYERALDLFLPPEVPADKTVLRRCEEGFAQLPPKTAPIVYTAPPTRPSRPPTKPRR